MEIDNIPQYYSFFGDAKEIFNSILNNELQLNGENVFEKILELLGSSMKSTLPCVSALMGITVVISVIEKLKLIDDKYENIALIGGKIIFSALIAGSSIVFINNAKECLFNVSRFTQILLPFMMTLLATTGAQGTVSILGPSQMLLSSVLINICVDIIYPILIAGFVICLVNEILSDNKLGGISSFLKNTSSWIMGGAFTVFSAIITIQGLTAGVNDGISMKSVKYALSSTVPVIGSSISESVSAVLLSAYSMKSAAGIMGIIVIAGIVIGPIVNIWAYVFVLNCFGACVQPFAGGNIVSIISKITDYLKLASTVLLGVSVLWFIFLGVLICAGGSLI